MKTLVLILLAMTAGVPAAGSLTTRSSAQEAIPAGTILPVQLSHLRPLLSIGYRPCPSGVL